MRMQVQTTISCPSSMNRHFTKRNMRKKEVYFLGVNWETADYICPKCGFIIQGYGNYVSRLEKENMDYKKIVNNMQNEIDDILCFEISGINNKIGYGKITIEGYEKLLELAQPEPEKI